MDHISFGDAGEDAAAIFLKSAGYKILDRKYRAKPGEIDIVAQINGTLVFIEVKARRSEKYGSPAEAVNYYKQRKIINTALCYIKQKGHGDVPLRFDIIEVITSGGNHRCNHIQNAFGN